MPHTLSPQALAALCRWVPGTTDRVLVKCGAKTVEWTISQVKVWLGARAVHDLYLRGRFEGPASREAQRAMGPVA